MSACIEANQRQFASAGAQLALPAAAGGAGAGKPEGAKRKQLQQIVPRVAAAGALVSAGELLAAPINTTALAICQSVVPKPASQASRNKSAVLQHHKRLIANVFYDFAKIHTLLLGFHADKKAGVYALMTVVHTLIIHKSGHKNFSLDDVCGSLSSIFVRFDLKVRTIFLESAKYNNSLNYAFLRQLDRQLAPPLALGAASTEPTAKKVLVLIFGL